jgi:predicted ATP-grasp superfamily ATP-dependent carboligase
MSSISQLDELIPQKAGEHNMSILIINYFSHETTPYEQLYESLNEPLVLLTSKETLHSYPQEAYSYVEAFENFPDNVMVIERAIQLHHDYQFRKVVALFEFDILRVAKLRELLNIEGQTVESAIHYRDKVNMKETVAAFGLRVPKNKRINDVSDLHSFIDTNGYPVIVKPVSGAGSAEIHVLQTTQDLELFLQNDRDLTGDLYIPTASVPVLTGLEVEEFISGKLHQVDGIVHNGEVVFICTAQYLGGNLIDYKSKGITGHWQLHPENPLAKRLFTYCKNVIKALDTPANTTFHCELFHTDDDDIVLCEIASRTGGALTATCVEETFGINLFHVLAQLQVDLPISLPNNGEDYQPENLTAYVFFCPKQGILRSIPTEEPPVWVKEYRLLGKVGQTYSNAVVSIEHYASFVIEGKSEQELQDRIQIICEWFNSQVSWELLE